MAISKEQAMIMILTSSSERNKETINRSFDLSIMLFLEMVQVVSGTMPRILGAKNQI